MLPAAALTTAAPGGERPFGIAIVEAAADEVAVKFFDESPVIKDALSESRAGGVVDEVGVNFVDRSVVDQGNARFVVVIVPQAVEDGGKLF